MPDAEGRRPDDARPDPVPLFGTRHPGCEYRARPGAYALIRDAEGRLLVVRAPKGLHLPGGGLDPGETEEEALRREVREECGIAVVTGRRRGRAIEYVEAEGEGCFEKRCAFFEARPDGTGGARRIETDHEPLWIPVASAAQELVSPSQRWAVARWLARGE